MNDSVPGPEPVLESTDLDDDGGAAAGDGGSTAVEPEAEPQVPEITFDEQFYPARPRRAAADGPAPPLRSPAGRRSSRTAATRAYVSWLRTSRCSTTPT